METELIFESLILQGETVSSFPGPTETLDNYPYILLNLVSDPFPRIPDPGLEQPNLLKHVKKNNKGVSTGLVMKGGSECSKMNILKISIRARTFLRNAKNGILIKKKNEKIQYLKQQPNNKVDSCQKIEEK